ncbi:hypothetical protein M514_06337 [Trichuris suis]|uniref:Uncharacterized protein n=1 Tax=Trichuris suis TaxID=68888 RepID=A0A085M6K0_9BILA|nr:hypothetical protein M513_06337 [Trichuris suis]KFD60812.1 hypothetical protein M514_06337 [Trichuris suis]
MITKAAPEKIMAIKKEAPAVVEHASQRSVDLMPMKITRESQLHPRRIKEDLFILSNPNVNSDKGTLTKNGKKPRKDQHENPSPRYLSLSSLSEPRQWHYVPTELKPADDLSRDHWPPNLISKNEVPVQTAVSVRAVSQLRRCESPSFGQSIRQVFGSEINRPHHCVGASDDGEAVSTSNWNSIRGGVQ